MKKEETEDRLFFRYQKIDEWTKDNLKNNVLYFNDPENFNDPFDCKIDIIHQGTKEDWSNYLCNSFLEINQLIKAKWMRRKKNIFILNRTKINNELCEEEVFKKSRYRVCCFSATNSNILMWSHYAENHQGICLCFKIHKEGNGYFITLGSKTYILFPVKYLKEKPKQVNIVTLPSANHKELMDFLLTKYSDWNYETEYRITIPKHEFEQDFTKKFRKEDLEGVIFGLNTEQKKIIEIYDIIDTHYLQQGIKVNFYRTHEIQGEFAIKVKKMESMREY